MNNESVCQPVACHAHSKNLPLGMVGAARAANTIIRFRSAIAAHDFLEPVRIPKLSASIGVPVRTLRNACQSQLRMTPLQYILLIRMQSVRTAIEQAVPGVRLTDIATAHGFYELGRFAVRYRCCFGETPSATLLCRQKGPRVILVSYKDNCSTNHDFE